MYQSMQESIAMVFIDTGWSYALNQEFFSQNSFLVLFVFFPEILSLVLKRLRWIRGNVTLFSIPTPMNHRMKTGANSIWSAQGFLFVRQRSTITISEHLKSCTRQIGISILPRNNCGMIRHDETRWNCIINLRACFIFGKFYLRQIKFIMQHHLDF